MINVENRVDVNLTDIICSVGIKNRHGTPTLTPTYRALSDYNMSQTTDLVGPGQQESLSSGKDPRTRT